MDGQNPITPNKKVLQFVVLALLLISLAGNYFLYQQNKKLATNPQAAVQEQIQQVVDRVSKLMVLPADETPTIVTIANTNEIKNQPFFANTKPGDQVLMYPNAQRVVIYRPSDNRIIEVGFINIGAQ